jgi:hypothetical protein
LVGLTLALLGARVVLTDLDNIVSEITRPNAARNVSSILTACRLLEEEGKTEGSSMDSNRVPTPVVGEGSTTGQAGAEAKEDAVVVAGRVTVMPCRWGTSLQKVALASGAEWVAGDEGGVCGQRVQGLDYVIAADCIYEPAFLPPLLQTIAACCAGSDTVCFMAFSLRPKIPEPAFLLAAAEHGLRVEATPHQQFPQPFRARASKFRLFRITDNASKEKLQSTLTADE